MKKEDVANAIASIKEVYKFLDICNPNVPEVIEARTNLDNALISLGVKPTGGEDETEDK